MAKGSRRRRGLGRGDNYSGEVSQTSQSPRSSQRERCPTVARLLAQAKGSESTSKGGPSWSSCHATHPAKRGDPSSMQGLAPCATGQWAVGRCCPRDGASYRQLLCWVLCTSDRGIEAKRRKGIEDLVEGEREERSLRRCGLAPPLLVPRREGGPKRSCLPGQSQSPHRSLQNRVTGFGCNNFSSIASSARG
jgi:hypothetical protein